MQKEQFIIEEVVVVVVIVDVGGVVIIKVILVVRVFYNLSSALGFKPEEVVTLFSHH